MTDTINHYLCNNHLPAMPSDDGKPHEPTQASVAPIYWRMKSERTSTQDMRAADWKAENGLVAVSAYNYDTRAVEWDESGLTVAELDADPEIERCNADGTPIAEPLTQTPDTSETSGVANPDAPLKVGDWVEILSIPPNVYGIKPGDTRQVDKIAKGSFRTLADNTAWWFAYCMEGINFRRVPPPSEQAERASEQDRIAELTMERDQLRAQLETANVNYDLAQGGWHSDHERMVQMRDKLAAAEADRQYVCDALGITKTEHGWQLEPADVTEPIYETFQEAVDALADQIRELDIQAHDRAQARDKLAVVQAEAAAMREALEWYREQVRRSYECTGAGHRIAEQQLIGDAIEARDGRDVAGKALNTTAGRDLLDELRRKDERIAELERHLAEQAPLVAIARELRGALNGRDISDWRPSCTGVSISGGYQSTSDTNRRLVTALVKLRDAEGGV